MAIRNGAEARVKLNREFFNSMYQLGGTQRDGGYKGSPQKYTYQGRISEESHQTLATFAGSWITVGGKLKVKERRCPPTCTELTLVIAWDQNAWLQDSKKGCPQPQTSSCGSWTLCYLQIAEKLIEQSKSKLMVEEKRSLKRQRKDKRMFNCITLDNKEMWTYLSKE